MNTIDDTEDKCLLDIGIGGIKIVIRQQANGLKSVTANGFPITVQQLRAVCNKGKRADLITKFNLPELP